MIGLHRIFVALLFLAALGGIRAEVAVHIQENSGDDRLTAVVMRQIVDDPDPTGRVWVRFTDDDNQVVLNEGGFDNGDGDPSLIVHESSGQVLATWSRNSATGYDVVFSVFDDGTWSVPVVLAGGPLDELDPSLAIDPADGSVHVVYWVQDAIPRVMHRQAPADLSSWSAEDQVSPPTEVCCRPTAAFFQGNLTVIYELHSLGLGATPHQITIATHDGQGFVEETLSTSHADLENWPEVHAAPGHLWVDWIDAEGEMAWSRRPITGPWTAADVEYFDTIEERDFHVRRKVRLKALE